MAFLTSLPACLLGRKVTHGEPTGGLRASPRANFTFSCGAHASLGGWAMALDGWGWITKHRGVGMAMEIHHHISKAPNFLVQCSVETECFGGVTVPNIKKLSAHLLKSSFQGPKTNGWNPPKLVVCRCFHLFPSFSVSEVMLAEEKETTNFEDLDASTDAGSELPELLGWNYLFRENKHHWKINMEPQKFGSDDFPDFKEGWFLGSSRSFSGGVASSIEGKQPFRLKQRLVGRVWGSCYFSYY